MAIRFVDIEPENGKAPKAAAPRTRPGPEEAAAAPAADEAAPPKPKKARARKPAR